jgi:hypothetical protein
MNSTEFEQHIGITTPLVQNGAGGSGIKPSSNDVDWPDTSDGEEVRFIPDVGGIRKKYNNVILSNDDYKVAYSENELIVKMDIDFKLPYVSWIVYLACSLPCICLAFFSVIPYTIYEGFMSKSSWDVFCIGRACIYGIVFLIAYIDVSIYCYKRVFITERSYGSIINYSLMKFIRQTTGVTFGLLYSFLYSIKWFNEPDLYARYVAICAFCIGWFLVFYRVIDKQLSSSLSISGSISSSVNSKRRRILLYSVKMLEELCYQNSEYSQKLYNSIIKRGSFALMFARINKAEFVMRGQEEKILSLYKESYFDKWCELRASVMNNILGVCLIVVMLAMLEDYGRAIYITFSLPEESYLWIATICCSILSCMYIICCYNIHHKYARTITTLYTAISCNTSRNDCIWILNILCRLPIIVAGGLIATTRMNSSYIMFGKIAGRFGMPYSIGMTFLWICIIIVFLIDCTASIKIVSYSIKRMISLLCTCISHPVLSSWHLYRCYNIRSYTKRTKWLIRQCNEEALDELCAAVLQ